MEHKTVLLLLVSSCLLAQVWCDGATQHHRSFNKEHIRGELHEMLPEDEFEGTNLETDEAMELHYFKLHDYDKNNKLDGLELGAAMTHYHEEDENGQEQNKKVDIDDQQLFELIQQMLTDDDTNKDGYVDFYEFMQAQRRASANDPAVDPAADNGHHV